MSEELDLRRSEQRRTRQQAGRTGTFNPIPATRSLEQDADRNGLVLVPLRTKDNLLQFPLARKALP